MQNEAASASHGPAPSDGSDQLDVRADGDVRSRNDPVSDCGHVDDPGSLRFRNRIRCR